ncbi:MAG: hypothetical protein M3313_12055 [Actinomycetota bacterium]|nr:hypothetical protein [Actinomycetota bacterium]
MIGSGKDSDGKDASDRTTGNDSVATSGERPPPTGRRDLSTLTWLLPAATFLIGLLIGFAVWGAGGNGDDAGGEAGAAPTATLSPNADDDDGGTATVTVPQSCLDAIEESEQSLDLLEEAVQAIGELDAGRLEEIVDELQGVSERIRELGDECRANAEVDVSTPTSSPTD